MLQHLAIGCPLRDRTSVIVNTLQVYSGSHGRALVFCETKREADLLATSEAMTADAHVLHGDIPQDKREMVLKVCNCVLKLPERCSIVVCLQCESCVIHTLALQRCFLLWGCYTNAFLFFLSITNYCALRGVTTYMLRHFCPCHTYVLF